MDSAEEAILEHQINELVKTGHQENLINLFPPDKFGIRDIPTRIGQWSVRHYKAPKNVSDNESVVALPITINARHLYELGCITLLLREGLTEAQAAHYLAASHGVSYAWLPNVVAGVKQMLRLGGGAQAIISSLKHSENPRKSALAIKIPRHPFTMSHFQFISMLEISEKIVLLEEEQAAFEKANALLERNTIAQ